MQSKSTFELIVQYHYISAVISFSPPNCCCCVSDKQDSLRLKRNAWISYMDSGRSRYLFVLASPTNLSQSIRHTYYDIHLGQKTETASFDVYSLQQIYKTLRIYFILSEKQNYICTNWNKLYITLCYLLYILICILNVFSISDFFAWAKNSTTKGLKHRLCLFLRFSSSPFNILKEQFHFCCTVYYHTSNERMRESQ